MNRFIAVLLVAAFLSGCVPRVERSVAASDLIFGTVPGTETVLRVKRPCPVGAPDLSRELPVGDYIPVYANSRGIFYAVPNPGLPVRQWEGWGIYFPIDARSSSPPFLWRQAVNTEWGRVRGEKWAALPEQCWQPYGTAMAIVRNGEEIPLR